MISRDFKSFLMISSDCKLFQTISIDLKLFQLIFNDLKWSLSWNEFKWVQVSPDDFKLFQILQNYSHGFQTIPCDFEWFRMIPTKFHCIEMSSSEFKWVQVISSEFNWSTSDVLVTASGVTPDSVICTSESIAKHRAGPAFLHCSSMSANKSSILNKIVCINQVQLFRFRRFVLGAKICSGKTCMSKVAMCCVLMMSYYVINRGHRSDFDVWWRIHYPLCVFVARPVASLSCAWSFWKFVSLTFLLPALQLNQVSKFAS